MSLSEPNEALTLVQQQTLLPPRAPRVLTPGQIAELRATSTSFREMHDIRLRIEAETAESRARLESRSLAARRA